MTQDFKTLFGKTESLVSDIKQQKFETLTIKEIEENYHEMLALLSEYIDVFKNETLMELCNCQQQS